MSLVLADPPALSACEDPAPGLHRQRLAFWRSPEGQPAWARPVLLGIAALAAFLFAWNITSAGLAPFYSVAVKSMSGSWRAFFYGAFDPKATITIDKLAGAFLPQALSARIFGFHPWSLALPQVIEGVISVLVMYRVVRRWAGVVPGLLAAGILALTPIAASVFGHSMEDGALTMCLVLAADAYQRAVTTGRLRTLLGAGVWVAVGFQAKMLQAWVILPALAIGYLVAAPGGLGRRMWHLYVAALVTVLLSLSWIALFALTPANDRPWVDGSLDNSAMVMVFGYNGLDRFGISVSGSVPTLTPGSGGSGTGGATPGTSLPGSGRSQAHALHGNAPTTHDLKGKAPAAPSPGGSPATAGGGTGNAGGWVKLADSRFGPEIGWLFPLAVAAMVSGLLWRRRAGRTDRLRGGFVMWGAWLLTFGFVYSAMNSLPHTAYLASLAPPIAALSGTGIVMFWHWYRSGGRRGWILPVLVAAQLGWAGYLWSGYLTFLPWASWIAVGLGAAAILALAVVRRADRERTGVATAALAAGVAAILAAPATWAASVLDVRYAGTSFDASAGPVEEFGVAQKLPGAGSPAGPQGVTSRGTAAQLAPGGSAQTGASPGAAGFLNTSATTLTAAQQRVYNYVLVHRHGASYLMGVASWSTAAPYITATGQEILAMGGFSGIVPEPALATIRQLIGTGQLRFFLLASGQTGMISGSGTRVKLGPGGSTSTSAEVINWVEKACSPVHGRASESGLGTLYLCTQKAARTPAPPSGAGAPGTPGTAPSKNPSPPSGQHSGGPQPGGGQPVPGGGGAPVPGGGL